MHLQGSKGRPKGRMGAEHVEQRRGRPLGEWPGLRGLLLKGDCRQAVPRLPQELLDNRIELVPLPAHPPPVSNIETGSLLTTDAVPVDQTKQWSMALVSDIGSAPARNCRTLTPSPRSESA